MVHRFETTKILDLDGLSSIRDAHPHQKIVHCHGVFDVLHGGHLVYFESAKKFGDVLVVTLTADKHVNKGPNRPYFTSTVRARMIAALEVVDYVCISEFSSATHVIKALKPNYYVKGPDYRDKAADVTGAIYEEEDAVKAGGGRLVFTEDETYSSSTLINKFFAPWSEDQLRAIELAREAGGLEEIDQVLHRLSSLKVMVVGEPIVDTYVFCQPEAISSKSPSISAKFISEENYAGGSLAVANHLSTFIDQVNLCFTHGGEPFFRQMLSERMNSNVRVHASELSSIPTPRKTRFIEAFKQQRIFEITDLASDQWHHHSPAEFCQQILDGNRSNDMTIICDFGHGLIESQVLGTLERFEGFVAVNAQTNSSNYGFNPFTKHRFFSFLNVDTREVRIAYHDRFTSPLELAKETQRQLSKMGAAFAMTTGPNGAYYFPADGQRFYHSPAFSDSVVDATGAGDAFYALAALLVKVGCPDQLIPFLGNVYAGLKTRIIGNKECVTKAQLIKAVTSILK